MWHNNNKTNNTITKNNNNNNKGLSTRSRNNCCFFCLLEIAEETGRVGGMGEGVGEQQQQSVDAFKSYL
jgi:hypothetical protein